MPFVAEHPERYEGSVVGSGQCVDFVRTVTNAPHTSLWIKGGPVWEGDDPAPGTAIATFSERDRYENNTDGSSHACILMEVRDDGLWVWDQWVEHPVAQRLIRFGNDGLPCDSAEAYSIIESAE